MRERLHGRELPCVWAATGNSDQLMISFVLHLVAVSGGDISSVHVVQFEKHASTGLRVRGTGDLTPDEMRAHPDPRKLTPIELAAYRDAWVAVTSNEPTAVSTFPARHPNAPWYLHEAVAKVLRRYPDSTTGPQLLGSPPVEGNAGPGPRGGGGRWPHDRCHV